VVLPTKEAFDACDFSQGVSLGDVSPVSYTVTETTYFSCSVPGHCFGGQKLGAMMSNADPAATGMVEKAGSPAMAEDSAPEADDNIKEVNWLFGFRDPSARATSVEAGTVLTFSWKGYHDVVVLPTKEAFDACDFSQGVSLGDVSPVSYTVTETTYFSCSVPGHCLGGQKLGAMISNADPAATGMVEKAETPTIVEIAAENDSFSTLVSLVREAGLVTTLNGSGPFTVFAPTNEAFLALPTSIVTWLTAEENRNDLERVLTYHVISGTVLSSDLVAGDTNTVEGQPVMVSLNPVMINTANVVSADIKASNGVVHAIDTVLIPSDITFSDGKDIMDDEMESSGYLTAVVWNYLILSSLLFWSATMLN